ncbi:MAG: NADH-quinone oxidoreductase subunit C [Kiritimatiellae bacterium]|nr:NADH-quinone oxidoreductase subunit C [Kiritimatiellia bacterium]
METPQEIVTIASSDLLAKVQEQKAAGHRLVQICATTLEQLELSYSFMGKEGITHLRLLLPRDQPSLPSITDIYFGAFAYENEMHDLFGIDIRDIRVDYKGKFYKISEPAPFNAGCLIPTRKQPS